MSRRRPRNGLGKIDADSLTLVQNTVHGRPVGFGCHRSPASGLPLFFNDNPDFLHAGLQFAKRSFAKANPVTACQRAGQRRNCLDRDLFRRWISPMNRLPKRDYPGGIKCMCKTNWCEFIHNNFFKVNLVQALRTRPNVRADPKTTQNGYINYTEC